MSNNLTTIVKHPLSKLDVAGYVRDYGEPDGHYITNCPCDRQTIFTGPVLDRLHAFESLGLEPEDIKSLMAAHSDLLPKKVIVETEFERYTRASCSVVEERRYYRCPSCHNLLANRYKITKLYANRTIGTEGNNERKIEYSSNNKCFICTQTLDWGDVDKETWS